MGRFIEIAVDAATVDAPTAQAVVRACPVDIYALASDGALVSVPDREDECILCGRCVALAPERVSVRRAYGARRPVLAAAEGGDG
jgi:NAD-dependent dihydropyrimidine dehydrogenase PreA subunit